MKKIFFVLFATLVIYNSGYSQKTDSLYSLSAYLGGGYAYNVTTFDYEFPSLNRGGLQGYARVMWKPEYLLSGGIEFGYTNLYSVDESSLQTDSGATSLKTNVYAYTLMIVFSMPIIENWEVNIGTGFGFTTVNNEAFSTESTSSDVASASMISTAYYFPVMKDSRLGGELGFTALPLYDDYVISLGISFEYKFLEY
ncbi:MAG: hypothetical protein ACHQ1D_06820 [Nitrososphaerales archaeon]